MVLWNHRRYGRGLITGLLGLYLSPVYSAANMTNILDIPLEELLQVKISTNRTPATSSALSFKVTVITEQEIRQQLALGLDTTQILANLIPSMAPSRQKLSGLGETLRGSAALIMIDGIPQGNPLRDVSRDGHVIDLEMVKSIEVIYGANAMQGLGATGGIINFITQDTLSEHKSATEFSSTINATNDPSSATSGYKLGLSHRVQQDAFSLLIVGTLEEQGLFKDGKGNLVGLEQVQGDIQDTRSHDVLLKAGYHWSQQELHFMVNDYEIVSHGDYVNVPGNIQTGILTSTKLGNTQGEPPGNRVKNIALDYRNNQFGDAELSSKLFWQEFAATFGATNTAIFQDPSLSSGIYDQSQMRSEKYGMKFSFYQPNIANTSLDLTTGLDFLDDKNSQPLLMTGRIWSPEMHFRNWSPFLQGDYHLTEKLTLNATLRQEIAKLDMDDYRTIATSGNTQVGGGELDFSETVYNLGAIYKLTPQWNLVFNDGEGFGMPDAGRELRAINKPGLQVEDIFAISPLVTNNREWGFFYAASNWQGQLNYFKSDAEHGTQLQLIDNVYRLNRRPSETKGWELNTRWQATPNTLVKLMYADIRGHYDSNGDAQLDSDLTALDLPPRRLLASWTQQWTNHWSSHLQWNYDATRDFQTRGATSASFEGYNLINVGLTHQGRWGNVSVGIANLTNRHYTTYFTQVVRRNDRFFAGQGRSFHLQYRVGF